MIPFEEHDEPSGCLKGVFLLFACAVVCVAAIWALSIPAPSGSVTTRVDLAAAPASPTTASPTTASLPPTTTSSTVRSVPVHSLAQVTNQPARRWVGPTYLNDPYGRAGRWKRGAPLLRQCESGGNYAINTGNGFSGAYQDTASTWRSFGTGYAYAYLAPASVQDIANENLYLSIGGSPWPVCSKKAGL